MAKAVVAPDGSWLAVASEGGMVRIWDTTTWESCTDFRDTKGVMEMIIAPDGSWLATVSRGSAVRIWDTRRWQMRATFPGGDGAGTVTVTPDGSAVATSGMDGTIRIYDMATEEIATMMRVYDILSASAWLSSERVAFGGLNGVYMFDFSHGTN
jgi:WD40 repeat protein